MIATLTTKPEAAYVILGFVLVGGVACLVWLWWLWWTLWECSTCSKPPRECRCNPWDPSRGGSA